MSPDLMNYLPLILLGLVALVLAVWVLSRLSRKARVVSDDSAAPLVRDVLDEGAAPAPRNQALIDAPRAVDIQETVAPPAPVIAGDTAPVVAAPAAATPDDLTRIKGHGPQLAALLGELGVTTYTQIAAWEPAEIERIDAKLGRFSGRITRDQWVEQAKLLAAGDESNFVAKFGQNG
jgi:predicted flap endonuclease-1-like 5' DNA nuclease